MKTENLIETWFNFSKYYNRISNAIDYTLKEHFGLELKEFTLLYTLSEADEKKLRLQDLHSKIDLSLSALSRMASRLQNYKDGELVSRVTSLDDKRSAYIVLSETGEELLESMLKTIDEALHKSLLPKDISNIVELLK
ncbi:MarR family winged helix-turn-helix transcriptional regulator [Terribacillus sp. DMT04]|uniref:MarR family winged helix-turn-helix transcriptional regulator n=1 Tax=Terribacillus sp. DMT04 TaxID=2850441 RepID=UPI001C2CA9C9|nr:MarR family transcriptional regulator [Terribacillus sp. DMT04]QXE03246.1 MarR family transcriptional regulator [Terribacillus sp. DMT04]